MTDNGAELEYLRSTPVTEILGNHFFVLLQVAALRLGETPPRLDEAQTLIDVLMAMLTAGGDSLGEHAPLYRSALSEVQQAFVRASSPASDGV